MMLTRQRRFLRTTWRVARAVARWGGSAALVLVLVCLGVLFLNYGVLSTPQARAYRDLDPAVPECRDGLRNGWTILSEVRRAPPAMPEGGGDTLQDPTNDEYALRNDPRWQARLRCSLQRHVIPSARGERPLAYTLGFLEFKEDGEPYALVSRSGGSDVAIDSAMLRHAMEGQMRARNAPPTKLKPVITQLDALTKHLVTGHHYVIAFVHGWRHDARVGIPMLRTYASTRPMPHASCATGAAPIRTPAIWRSRPSISAGAARGSMSPA